MNMYTLKVNIFTKQAQPEQITRILKETNSRGRTVAEG